MPGCVTSQRQTLEVILARRDEIETAFINEAECAFAQSLAVSREPFRIPFSIVKYLIAMGRAFGKTLLDYRRVGSGGIGERPNDQVLQILEIRLAFDRDIRVMILPPILPGAPAQPWRD